MQDILHNLLVNNLLAFLMIFARLGTALMVMPGIGDTFVSPQIRLFFALSFSLVLTPVLSPLLPPAPEGGWALFLLLSSEMLIGFFAGAVMRILTSALDTAGTIASSEAGLSNAMLFNPATNSQGSVMSGLYSALGVTLLLATDMHHLMLASLVKSYELYPALGSLPPVDTMSQIITKVVSSSFLLGVQIGIPFIIVNFLLQFGMGFLGRLMPQLQVFFIALPLQIYLTLMVMLMCISAGSLFWLDQYGQALGTLFTLE